MAGRPSIAESVLDLIGNTPLVRLNRVAPAGGATVLVVESEEQIRDLSRTVLEREG